MYNCIGILIYTDNLFKNCRSQYLSMCFNSHFQFIYLNTLTIKSAKFPKLKTLFTGWIMQCVVAVLFWKMQYYGYLYILLMRINKVCRSCFNIQIEVLWEFMELMFNCTWSMINHSHVTWDPTSCHKMKKCKKYADKISKFGCH